MADLASIQNRRRIRIVTQRSAFTLAFLSCLLVRQVMIWLGMVKVDDTLGTLIMTKLHWFLVAALIGGIAGAILSYIWYTSWLARKPDDY